MTEENRKVLTSEILAVAEEMKSHIPKTSPERPALNRIIKIAKLLHVDAIKTEV